MAEFTGYIYSITNEINGHVYIGKTNDLVRRWKEHCYNHGGTAILNKAFKKYGLEHFVFEIVAQIPFDDINELNDVLKQLEIYYISLYNSYKNGYNATVGGDGISGYKQSKETTEKIRKANIGRAVSDETKAKISASRKGIGHSEETKKKITNALLSRDHSIYEKISEKRRGVKRDPKVIMKGAVKRRKPILQYDLQGNFIKEFPGATFAGYGKGSNITACCHNRLLSANGYIWRFKECENYPLKIHVDRINSTRKRAVVQRDLDGNIINVFPSLTEAAKFLNVYNGNLCKYLKRGDYIKDNTVWNYENRKEVMYA